MMDVPMEVTDKKSSSGRHAILRAVLPPSLFEKLQKLRVLVVGAGGIGCELLKDLVLSGAGKIDVIDLDTIDVTNLNRQFLFRRADVDKSKAECAAAAVKKFNPDCEVEPHMSNVITNSAYDVQFFKRFHLVINGLDNVKARAHVNLMCVMAGRPLIDAGSTGWKGQSSLFLPSITNCYDCTAKTVPKGFAQCTIRQVPQIPEHCVGWGKLLLQLLFEDITEDHSFTELREKIDSKKPDGFQDDAEYARAAFEVFFHDDIAELKENKPTFKNNKRVRPLPFDFEEIVEDPNAASTSSSSSSSIQTEVERMWTLEETRKTFVQAVEVLRKKKREEEVQIVFDKDAKHEMDLVAAAANLRMWNYSIKRQTRWWCQEIAGNIIPAIASTNAAVAAFEVRLMYSLVELLPEDFLADPSSYNMLEHYHQALKRENERDRENDKDVLYPLLRGLWLVHRRETKALMAEKPNPPNGKCTTCCRVNWVCRVRNFSTVTLRQLTDEVIKERMQIQEFTLRDLWEDDKVLVEVFEVGELDDPEEIEEEQERQKRLDTTLEALELGGKIVEVVDTSNRGAEAVNLSIVPSDPLGGPAAEGSPFFVEMTPLAPLVVEMKGKAEEEEKRKEAEEAERKKKQPPIPQMSPEDLKDDENAVRGTKREREAEDSATAEGAGAGEDADMLNGTSDDPVMIDVE